MPIIKRSSFSFGQTLSRLEQTIADAGNTVFATIDQAAAAAQAGLTLRPTALIVFGNPRAGTVLMDAFPLTGLDLPLKILIWEDDSSVNVAYTPISEVALRYAVVGNDQLTASIDRALAVLSDSVVEITPSEGGGP